MFRDRQDAGEQLARRLGKNFRTIQAVFFLPRGGAEIAFPIAEHFGCPMVPVIVARLRDPFRPENTIGSMNETGEVYLSLRPGESLTSSAVQHAIREASRQLEQQKRAFASLVPGMDKHGGTVVLVDDGLTTGNTAKSALKSLKRYGARSLVLAVPCATTSALNNLRHHCTEMIVLERTHPDFEHVRESYENYAEVSQERVHDLMIQANSSFIPTQPALSKAV